MSCLSKSVLSALRKHEDWFTTGDLARACELTLRAIRHYEALGLIRASGRSEGKHRVFSPSELARVRLIGDLRTLGLGLDQIGEILSARERSATGAEAAGKVLALIDTQIGALDRAIKRLRRTKDELAATTEHLAECTICKLPLDDRQCRECDRLEHDALPRLTRLLWLRDEQLAPIRARAAEGE